MLPGRIGHQYYQTHSSSTPVIYKTSSPRKNGCTTASQTSEAVFRIYFQPTAPLKKRRFIPVNTCTRNSNHADFALPNHAQTWQDCNQLNENLYSTLQSPALCAGQKGRGRHPAEGLRLPYAAPPLFNAFTLVNIYVTKEISVATCSRSNIYMTSLFKR